MKEIRRESVNRQGKSGLFFKLPDSHTREKGKCWYKYSEMANNDLWKYI